MKLIPQASLLLGVTHAFFSRNEFKQQQNNKKFLDAVDNSRDFLSFGDSSGLQISDDQDGFSLTEVNYDASNNNNNHKNQGGRTISMSNSNTQNYDTSVGSPTETEVKYGPPVEGMGALAAANAAKVRKAKERESAEAAAQKARENGPALRSTSTGAVSQIITPSEAISEGHDENVMILSSDYMFVSNCLLKNRHANDPIRQQAFELFKQTAAGDWFIVFGYVCNDDYKCWKKSVQNLLMRKGDAYGGEIVGRCVSRLVREKAEGLRARKRKRRSNKQLTENLNTKSGTNYRQIKR